MVDQKQGVTNEILLLKKRLEDEARLLGDFTLSSGAKSKYYFDSKPTTISVTGIDLIARVMLPLILERHATCVGGLEIGAVPISLELSKLAHSRGIDLPSCIVRDAKKGHGTKDLIPMSIEFARLSNRRVAVVDDVITSGISVDQAVHALRDDGCEIACVVALVTRPEKGGMAAMKKKFGEVEYLSVFECDFDGNLTPLVSDLVAAR